MNYKLVVTDLIEHLNNLTKDPFRKLKGNFRVQEIMRSTVSSDGQQESIELILIYEDLDIYIPIRHSRVLEDTKNGYIASVDSAYKSFYRILINYILFAKDSRGTLADGNVILTIPINKLLEEGYGRK